MSADQYGDHRIDRHSFGGIVIQEYSDKEQKLIGKPKVIFEGTDRKLTEAPHLYHIGNYYAKYHSSVCV